MNELETVVSAADEAAVKQVETELSKLSAETRRDATLQGIIAGLVSVGASEAAAMILAPSILKKTNDGGRLDILARSKFHKAQVH